MSDASSTRRTLTGYRLAVVLLLAVIVALVLAFSRAFAPAPPRSAAMGSAGAADEPVRPRPDIREPGTIQLFDLPRRFAWIERTKRDWSDISETFYRSSFGSVHMHTMGLRQVCPLHLHPDGEEATVIVAGTARVTAYHGQEGAIQRRQALFGAGALLQLAPGSGHRFDNAAPDRMLGNLVFASRPFGGNLYLDPEDPRLLQGHAIAVRDPRAEAARFVASGAAQQVIRLPGFGGRLLYALARARLTLPGAGKEPLVAYTLLGAARLDGQDRTLSPGLLAVLHHRSPLQLQVSSSDPLILLLFRPEGAWRADAL